MYIVCDNGVPSLCDTAYVFIDVVGNPNTAPIALIDSFTTPENFTMTESVALNDMDPENDPLTFTWLTQPTHGTFSMSADGTFIYTPTLDYIGVDSFKYVVCDNGTPSLCDTNTCIITVVNTPKPSIGVALHVEEPVTVTTETYNITYDVTLTNYGDVDLENVRVTENLANVFVEPGLYSIVSITPSEGMAINPNFDGNTNRELLDATNSYLAVGESRVIKIKLLVTPNLPVVTYVNKVTAFGDMIYGDSTVTDESVAGLNADPNGDGNPSEASNTELPLTLFVPTGFSPDGDGVNDGFVIKGIENYPQNSLSIFNRWGNKVYEQSPYDNSWGGGTKNASGLVLSNGTLPNGTYFYVLDFGVPSVKPVTGYIVIKK
jgi:gliding motility-associated-like protein